MYLRGNKLTNFKTPFIIMKKFLLSILAVAAGCGYFSAAAETTATVGDKYTRVDSVSDITANGEYIICYSTNAMGAQSGTKFRTRIANGVTLSDDSKVATIDTTGVVTFSIIAGTTTGSYAFKFDDTAYMQCKKTDNGSVSNSTTLAETCDMTLSLSDGVATLTFVKNSNNGKNKFQYNKNSNQERFTNYKTGTQQNCSIYKKNTDDSKCATPKFSPAAGAVDKGTVVTISCSTDSATLVYTINDGDAITAEGNTATVTINDSTTIAAYATKAGLADSEVATATYTPIEYVNATSIADAYTQMGVADLEKNASTETFKVGFEPVVTYANGANIYIYDGVSYGYIFKYDTSLNAGDKIAADWKATVKNYNGLYEFIPDASADLTADGTATVPAAITITTDDLIAANQSELVILKEVVIAEATPGASATGSARSYTATVNGETINLFNNFKNESMTADTYDITGIIGVFGTTVQLQPISFVKCSSGVSEIVASENTPAEYYNLQGIRVNNPENGVYIRRQGNTVTKVLVK